ncbi:hypothetical protein S245_016357, partial [Arachis hypogaea]
LPPLLLSHLLPSSPSSQSSLRRRSCRVCSLSQFQVKNGHDGFLAVQSGIAYLKRILHIFPNCSLIRNLVGYLSLSGKELNSCYAICLQGVVNWTFLTFLIKKESLLHMGRRIIVVGDAGPEFDNNEFRRWFRSILTQYKRAKPESILRYWQYSINEHGTQDIPAMIEKIHEKSIREEPSKRKNPGAVKISPWTLARLNAEELKIEEIVTEMGGLLHAKASLDLNFFFCSSDKEYNDLATIFFNTQDDAIRNLFSVKTIHVYSSQSLLTFLVVGSSEESIASSVAQAVLSEREIEAIVGSLGAEWAEERVAAVEILLKCMQEDSTCRNIIADKAQLSTFLESLVGATEGELFKIDNFLSELVKLNRRTFNEQILHIIKEE